MNFFTNFIIKEITAMKNRLKLLPALFSLFLTLSGCSSVQPTTSKEITDSKAKPKQGEQPKAEKPAHLETGSRNPEWMKNSVIYEVNWRQYTKDGTIKAFQEHLPRLKEMGIDVLWFMPIHPISQTKRIDTLGSYYAVGDYTAVNSEFGTMEEFKSLVRKCHDMGFKVILDWVANHTGWDNPWLANTSWYTQNEQGQVIWPEGTNWEDVADLNYDNMDMRNAMIDAMKFWVKEADIDGYRCDYAGGVPQDFWETAAVELNKIKPIYMLAEDDQNLGLLNEAFATNYNWPLYGVINDIAKGNKNALDVKLSLENIAYYPEGSYPMNFITNHDENSWNGTEYERLGKTVKAMTALTFTAPGTALIYSGQEAALNKRLQFFIKDEISWKDLPMQEYYKQLINLKKENKALWNGKEGGNLTFLETSDNNDVLAFCREKEENKVIVIMNLTDNPKEITLKNNSVSDEYKLFPTNQPLKLELNQSLKLQPWEYRILTK